MKLFDKISEDVRKVLQQVEGLSPILVTWKDDNHECPITRQLEAFFTEGRRLEPDEKVSLKFARNVDDGVLTTCIRVTAVNTEVWCDLAIILSRRAEAEELGIVDLHFRTKGHNESPRTVMYVHDWVRAKARSHFVKTKEAHDAKLLSQEQLRDKYKP